MLLLFLVATFARDVDGSMLEDRYSWLLLHPEIKPPVDDQDNIIQLKAEFTDGVLV